jgi:hypothetical protein
MSPAVLARARLEDMLGLTRAVVDKYPVAEEPLVGPNVHMDVATGLVTVDVEIFVDRPVRDVACAIDPQNWDLASRFFHPDGTFIVDPARLQAFLDGDFSQPGTFTPPQAGTDYEWAILYERFEAHAEDGVGSTFHNLLWVNPDWIRTPDGVQRYVLSYMLHTGLRGRVGLVNGVRIERDDGELSAKPIGDGRSRVRMRKRIRFESEWANLATYAGFRVAQNDLDDQFLETASAGLTTAQKHPSIIRRRAS